MSLLTATFSHQSRYAVKRTAPRVLSFATKAAAAATDGTDDSLAAPLSKELLRALSMLRQGGGSGDSCPILTQKIEDISTAEVMKAVKSRDFGAIANLQWTVEVDYLRKMEEKEMEMEMEMDEQRKEQEAKKNDEYSSDFKEEWEASALP